MMHVTQGESKPVLPAVSQRGWMTVITNEHRSWQWPVPVLPQLPFNENTFDGRVLSQVGLNSSFTNDPNFNQWPRNETLHFSNLSECTINKTYKMSRPWKHEIQHAGMCLLLTTEFRNEMFHGPQKGARSNFKKKHKSFLPHK